MLVLGFGPYWLGYRKGIQPTKTFAPVIPDTSLWKTFGDPANWEKWAG